MMKKTLGVMISMFAFAALAMPAERWIHVRVTESGPDGERVRINIPLSLAEAILPTIKAANLREGKVKVEGNAFDQVDVRAMLEAVRKAGDNQFVTVESKKENVEVAKSGEFLLIKVHENREGAGKTAGRGRRRIRWKSGSRLKLPMRCSPAKTTSSMCWRQFEP